MNVTLLQRIDHTGKIDLLVVCNHSIVGFWFSWNTSPFHPSSPICPPSTHTCHHSNQIHHLLQKSSATFVLMTLPTSWRIPISSTTPVAAASTCTALGRSSSDSSTDGGHLRPCPPVGDSPWEMKWRFFLLMTRGRRKRRRKRGGADLAADSTLDGLLPEEKVQTTDLVYGCLHAAEVPIQWHRHILVRRF